MDIRYSSLTRKRVSHKPIQFSGSPVVVPGRSPKLSSFIRRCYGSMYYRSAVICEGFLGYNMFSDAIFRVATTRN